MSHFSVLVATKDEPTETVLKHELQPFHEYECTGIRDEFVLEIDKTDECRAEYEILDSPHSQSLEEWAVNYHGHELINGRIIDVTNPNKKWDWWTVGGRYSDRLISKDGGVHDSLQAKELAKEKMAAVKRTYRHGEVQPIVSRLSTPTWEYFDSCLADSRLGHKLWLTLDEPRPRGNNYPLWLIEVGHAFAAELRSCTRMGDLPEIPEVMSAKDWVESAPWLTSFAFLRERKWAEAGRMGWFACVSNENDNWPADFQALVNDVPDDWWITIVDCHI